MAYTSGTRGEHPRRMLKKFVLLTRPIPTRRATYMLPPSLLDISLGMRAD